MEEFNENESNVILGRDCCNLAGRESHPEPVRHTNHKEKPGPESGPRESAPRRTHGEDEGPQEEPAGWLAWTERRRRARGIVDELGAGEPSGAGRCRPCGAPLAGARVSLCGRRSH